MDPDQDSRAAERADVLALLKRRLANCELLVARGGAEWDEMAKDRARQLGVIIEEIEAGRHLGEAELGVNAGVAAAVQL